MGKIRFGIVEITADGKKTIERVYNLDRFELKNANTYEIKQEFSSVQEMDIAYKTLTTGKIVQSTIRTIEPFSVKYNKLHNIWYLGKSLPCLHCVLVQVGGVFPEDYKSYLEEGEEYIYTNDKNEYIKWYDYMLRNKKLTK